MKNRLVLWIAGTVLLAATSALSQAPDQPFRGVSFVPNPRSEDSSRAPDSAEALRRFLQNALAVARSGNDRKLAALVDEMQIPDYRAWFAATYGPVGSPMAEAYGAKLSDQNLARVRMLRVTARAMKLSRARTVLVRRVNDAPYEGDPFERNVVRNLQRPVNVYFAYHDASGAPNRNPIGYFVYVDGKFRWQSGFVEDAVTHRIIIPGER